MINYWLYSKKYQNFKQKIAQKKTKTKNIFSTSISPKTLHFDQQTKSGHNVEPGEEYQTGPFDIDNTYK